MGYVIQALIALEDELLDAPVNGASVVSLRQGYGLIPLTTDIRKVYDLPSAPLIDGRASAKANFRLGH